MVKFRDEYKKGDYLVMCAICGCQMHRSKTRRNWKGFLVCFADWEPKNVSDYPPPTFKREGTAIVRTQPIPPDTFQADTPDSTAYTKNKRWGFTENLKWGSCGSFNTWGNT